MATTREARYLCGNDLGKTFEVAGLATGLITAIEFTHGRVNITYLSLNLAAAFTILHPDTPVTITGQSSKDK